MRLRHGGHALSVLRKSAWSCLEVRTPGSMDMRVWGCHVFSGALLPYILFLTNSFHLSAQIRDLPTPRSESSSIQETYYTLLRCAVSQEGPPSGCEACPPESGHWEGWGSLKLQDAAAGSGGRC